MLDIHNMEPLNHFKNSSKTICKIFFFKNSMSKKKKKKEVDAYSIGNLGP